MMRRRHPSGFTLLELLLALTAAALLSLSLYMSLRIAVDARDRAATQLPPVRTAAYAMDTIGKDFQSALPPDTMLTGGYYSTSGFVGALGSLDGQGAADQSTVEFYSVGYGKEDLDDPTRASGLKLVSYGISHTADGQSVLVRRVTRNILPPPTVEPQYEDQVVARNVRSFMLLYSDGTQNVDPSNWIDEWDSLEQATLPAAVEVILELNVPPLKQGQEPRVYRSVRIFPLPCHKDPNATSGSTTGGGA